MAGHPHVAGEKLPEPLIQHDKVRAFDLPMEHDFFPPLLWWLLTKAGAFGAQGQERRPRFSVKEK